MMYSAWDSIRARPGVYVDSLQVEAALVAWERKQRDAARRAQRTAEREAARAMLAAEDYVTGRHALSEFWDVEAQRLYTLARQREAAYRAMEARYAASEWSAARAALAAFCMARLTSLGHDDAPLCTVGRVVELDV